MKIAQKFANPSLCLVSAMAGVLLLGQVTIAQSEIRHGILPVNRLADWEQQTAATLSSGTLAELETDPNFSGDYGSIYNVAAHILDDYIVVQQAGYFPENAGIPREKQLGYAQAVYYFYVLPNSNSLILYRSPADNTARYIIRKPGSGFLLTQP